MLLLVEDEREIRETLKEILTDSGFQVATAANGREALATLRQVQPCLMLLDLEMPEMNGWEVAEALHRDSTYPPVPLVLLSAHHDLGDAARRLGASGYLTKPFEVSTLLTLIHPFC